VTEPSYSAADAPSASLVRAAGACAIGALVALAVAAVWASFHRGPWYDEFYTQLVTRPDRGLIASVRGSWLHDNHPPLFYLLSWLTGWLGPIETHRLLNIGILAIAIAAAWAIVRKVSALHLPAAALVLMLSANMWAVMEASELRSYFLSLCTGATLALALTATWLTRDEGDRWRRIAALLVALAAFNNHIVTTIVSGSVVVPFAALALLRRAPPLFVAIMRAPFFAGLVFLALTAIQFPYWMDNTQSFWITPGLQSASWSFQYAIQRMLEANPLLSLAAVAGAALMAWDTWKRRDLSPRFEAALLLGCGCVMAIVILIILHMVRPMIIEKYLTSLIATIALGLALGVARSLRSLPSLAGMAVFVLALLTSFYQLAANAHLAADKYSWYGTGRFIAQAKARCPGTVVHTDPFWNVHATSMSPADNKQVPGLGYRTISDYFGFKIEPEASLRMAADCPTLFWAEHNQRVLFDAGSILAHIRDRGYPVDRLTLYRVGDGWVASNRPLTYIHTASAAAPSR
jgi:hypothetical protein